MMNESGGFGGVIKTCKLSCEQLVQPWKYFHGPAWKQLLLCICDSVLHPGWPWTRCANDHELLRRFLGAPTQLHVWMHYSHHASHFGIEIESLTYLDPPGCFYGYLANLLLCISVSDHRFPINLCYIFLKYHFWQSIIRHFLQNFSCYFSCDEVHDEFQHWQFPHVSMPWCLALCPATWSSLFDIGFATGFRWDVLCASYIAP